jgi:hypothetical protein
MATAPRGTEGGLSDPLDAHLNRLLAPSGIRRSRLVCLSDGGRSVSLELAGAWSVERGTGISLFCVGPGGRLAGTTVLIRERPGAAAELWIWLPTSKTVRKLDPRRVDDWVLGSDFVYDDFRIWTPRLLSETALSASRPEELVFRGEYAWRREVVEVEAVLDRGSGLVRTASWIRGGTGSPLRRLEARDIAMVGATATPAELVVSREGGFESRMELLGQVCPPSFDGISLSPDDLPTAGGALWRAVADLGMVPA